MLIIGFLAAGAGAQSGVPVDLQFVRGDVDGDGVVEFVDDVIALTLLPAYDQPMPADRSYYFSEGDLNHDGLVNIDDADVIVEEIGKTTATDEPPIPSIPGVLIGAGPEGALVDNTDVGLTASDVDVSQPTLELVPLLDGSVPTGPPCSFSNNHNTLWRGPGSLDKGESPHLEPTLTIEGTGSGITDGFNLIAEWDNTAGVEPMNYGRIWIPFIKFGPQVYYRNFTRSSEERLIDLGPPPACGEGGAALTTNLGSYPRAMYAPTLTFRGFVSGEPTAALRYADWPDLSNDSFNIPIGRLPGSDFADWWEGSSVYRTSEPPMPAPNADKTFREYVMGVTAEYPVLEYGFKTQFRIQRFAQNVDASTDSIYWSLVIEPNPKQAPRGAHGESISGNKRPQTGIDDGRIPVGETRVMTIRVRFYRPQTWFEDVPPTTAPSHRGTYLNLFREYRRYFKKQYGDVQHERDPRPLIRVLGGHPGQCGNTSCFGDWGFNSTPANPGDDFCLLGDYDGDGWARYFQDDPSFFQKGIYRQMEERGFFRTVTSGPSGALCPAGYNWPFQISSRWNEIAAAETAIQSPGSNPKTHKILTTLEDLGKWETTSPAGTPRELQLWWGRATLPYDVDGNGTQVLLDLTAGSPEREAAMMELNGMKNTDLTSVGLDASSVLPEWGRYHWLQILRHDSRSSWVERFTTEAYAADFVHTLMPTHFQMTKPDRSSTPPFDPTEMPGGPHAMIDFLNRGADRLGHLQPYDDELGNPVIPDRIEALRLAKILARRGFAPAFATGWSSDGLAVNEDTNDPINPMYIAEDSWLLTVPDDLRLP